MKYVPKAHSSNPITNNPSGTAGRRDALQKLGVSVVALSPFGLIGCGGDKGDPNTVDSKSRVVRLESQDPVTIGPIEAMNAGVYINYNTKQFTLYGQSTIRYGLKGTPTTTQSTYVDNVLGPGTYTIGAATLGQIPGADPGSGFAIAIAVSGQAPLPTQVTETSPATSTRPSYNTGIGFFVRDGALYDANGVRFRIRGINKNHYDAQSSDAVAISGANTQRLALFFDGHDNRSWDQVQNMETTLLDRTKNDKIVSIVGNWAGTVNSDPAVLTTIVNQWISRASWLKPYERYMIYNIANEWGPATDSNGTNTVWRDSYITAVASMRSAGYLGTLMIDCGGAGQDPWCFIKHAQAVFDSDSQKNIVFSLHVYESTPLPGMLAPILQQMRAAAPALPLVVGEFGPIHSTGINATFMSPEEVIQICERLNIGWMPWSWDDFGAVFPLAVNTATAGFDAVPLQLTPFGDTVVNNPTYGLKALAVKATVFQDGTTVQGGTTVQIGTGIEIAYVDAAQPTQNTSYWAFAHLGGTTTGVLSWPNFASEIAASGANSAPLRLRIAILANGNSAGTLTLMASPTISIDTVTASTMPAAGAVLSTVAFPANGGLVEIADLWEYFSSGGRSLQLTATTPIVVSTSWDATVANRPYALATISSQISTVAVGQMTSANGSGIQLGYVDSALPTQSSSYWAFAHVGGTNTGVMSWSTFTSDIAAAGVNSGPLKLRITIWPNGGGAGTLTIKASPIMNILTVSASTMPAAGAVLATVSFPANGGVVEIGDLWSYFSSGGMSLQLTASTPILLATSWNATVASRPYGLAVHAA